MLDPVTACSCGRTDAHVMARRQTSDGRSVQLWSDGQVTWAFGHTIQGHSRAREPWAEEADLTAGWALMGWVEILDAHEVAPALRALRDLCRRPYQADCSWGWNHARGGPLPDDARRVILRAIA